ncbi:MAG: hypothetical protein A3H41_01355 [Omnitrophica WOR_2 bacterium RIFCSPLOWO2_02_FULL_45_28]|nr:MAG: hypothetical protein A3H41_01355 [Omnitrophica WOR_2 bacterium RIFCSPLOWO2_02_FULL_45_28]
MLKNKQMKILQNCLILLILGASFLIFSVIPAYSQEPQTSYIIVHCHNPEGKEINSIEGMTGIEVEIYDGDTFEGYGAYNTATHNQPIPLAPGSHTIKVKFNGITLEQNITLDSGVTKVLTFVFERRVWDFVTFLNGIGHVREEKYFYHEMLSAYEAEFLHNLPYPLKFIHTNVGLHAEPWQNKIVTGTLYGDMTIIPNNLDIDLGVIAPWSDADSWDLGMHWGYYIAETEEFISNPPDFTNWYIQNEPTSNVGGNASFTSIGDLGFFITNTTDYRINTVTVYSLRGINIVIYRNWWNDFYVYNSQGEGYHIVYHETFTHDKVYISSVPYDLTGTAVGDEHKLFLTEVKTDKTSYTTGEEVVLSTKLIDCNDGIPVSSVFVTAEITKPDSSVETILVSENQPGNYEGIFTDISLLGTYNAIIKAQKQGYIDAIPITLTFIAERNKIPLGKSLSITNPDIEFYSIYVPDRYGGDLTVTATGSAIGLYYPDPYTRVADAATQINYPVAFNQHGWYYVRVFDRESISKISNSFVQTGEASYRPWNFWYWPFLKDELHPEKNLYKSGGVLDKYDRVFGTDARRFEEEHYSTTDSEKFWWGHCWGAVVASILLPQPEAITYNGQSFIQEEMEGLVTKLADKDANFEIIINNIPPLKPQLGADDTDEFADNFHLGLVDYIRDPKERKPLQSNLRDPQGINPSAVWNHVIYKYSSTMEESEEGDEHIIKITTTVYANGDLFSSDNTVDRIETYVYKLRYKPNGQIDDQFVTGQDWISATGFAPKSLRLIRGSRFNNPENPYVIKENVEKLGVNFPGCPSCP